MEKVRFSIVAGSSWEGCEASFEVPKGTTIETICKLLEVDSLETYNQWCAEGNGEYIKEGEMRNGSYRIGYDKRSNFDKIDEQFREQKR